MIALVLLTSIHSASCVAFVPDGETITRCDGKTLRLAGIEVPEADDSPQCSSTPHRNACWCDTRLAEAAQKALENFVSGGDPTIWYAGRKDPQGAFLVSIEVNGIDAGRHLLGLGLARGQSEEGVRCDLD